MLTNQKGPPCIPRARRRCSVHRIPSAFVTIAIRPSWGRDGGGLGSDLGQVETEIFLKQGLDWWNRIELFQQNSLAREIVITGRAKRIL
jgi:hypothetical protein